MKSATTIRNLLQPGLLKGLLGCVLLVQAASPLLAQDAAVELSDQIQLILAAIERDRNFVGEGSVRLAIVYDPSEGPLKDEILTVFQGYAETPRGLPVTYFALAYSPDGEWEQEARRLEINVLYITPGDRNHLQQLVEFCRRHGIMSTTGEPDFVKQGVSLGLALRLGKPRFIIHIGAAKCEGTEFTSLFLRLTTTRRIKQKIDCFNEEGQSLSKERSND